jgi:hypothetical protein
MKAGRPERAAPLSHFPSVLRQPSLPRPSSARARGALQSIHEAPVKVVLESLPGEGDGEMWAGCDHAIRSRENRRGERNGITDRATDSEVKLPRQRNVDQGWPRDTAGDSAGPGLNPGQLLMCDEVIGPFLRRVDRNRSHRNAIEAHLKFLFSEE